jgi:hypothetical protein
MPTNSYSSRILAKAKHETALFTWRKLVTGLCMAVTIRIALWYFAGASAKWSYLWRDLLIIVGSYVFVVIISFLVNLVRAPGLLDAESQETIKNLNRQLELPDKALADHLIGLLQKVSQHGKSVLRFLLLYEHQIGRYQIKPEGLSDDEVSTALRECFEHTLVESHTEAMYTGMPISVGNYFATYYWIPDGFRPILKRLLYGDN